MNPFDDATAMTAAIRSCTVGSEELLDAHLARIEAHNATINAVVALDVDRARARAREADRAAARGDWWGPLHGLPMTIKDSIETEGLVTTSGSVDLRAHIPARDATAVASLKAAGAIVFGKTNLPLLAGDLQSYNDVYGTTNNPWDLTRTRRILRRGRGCPRHGHDTARAGERHRGVHPDPGVVHRGVWHQAVVRDSAGTRPRPGSARHAGHD